MKQNRSSSVDIVQEPEDLTNAIDQDAIANRPLVGMEESPLSAVDSMLTSSYFLPDDLDYFSVKEALLETNNAFTTDNSPSSWYRPDSMAAYLQDYPPTPLDMPSAVQTLKERKQSAGKSHEERLARRQASNRMA